PPDGNRSVVYRPHPQSPFHYIPKWADELNCTKDFGSTLWTFRPSQIITHCSTAGLEALCLTYPVDTHPSAFYHNRERTEVMNSCAESQFNLTELRNATALNYINQRLAAVL